MRTLLRKPAFLVTRQRIVNHDVIGSTPVEDDVRSYGCCLRLLFASYR